jgi:threonine dehydrogenase-like Zn-dependent dehydrogenase
MKAWFVRGVGDMVLDNTDEPGLPQPGFVNISVHIVQPSVAEAMAHSTGRWRHSERVAKLLAEHGPQRLFGHEFCGSVTAVGAGVSGIAFGDRATCIEPASPFGQVGLELPGAFGEQLSVPAECVVRVPAGVPDFVAAAVQPMCYAQSTVTAAGDLAGAKVMVFGQGSIGLPLAQLARVAGAAAVTVVVRRAATVDAALAAGADEVLDSTAPNFEARLAELADECRIDVAFDAASGPREVGLAGTTALEWSMAVVRPGGRIAVAAALGRTELDLQLMQRKGLSLAFPRQHVAAEDGNRVLELLADGRVKLTARPELLVGVEHIERAMAMCADKRGNGMLLPPQVAIGSSGEVS